MGSSQSSTITECTSQLNANITSVLTSQNVATTSNTININTLTVDLEGANLSGNCTMNMGQTITVDQNIKSVATLTSSDQIQTVLTNAVQNTLSSNSAAVNKFVSTTYSGQNTKTQALNSINNIIANKLDNTQVTNLINFIKNINTGTLDMKGITCSDNATYNSPSEIVVNSTVTNLSNMLTTAMMTNSEIANGVNTLNNEQSSENEGLGDAISGVFKSMNWMIVGLVVVVVILILFVPKIIDSLGGSQGISQIMQSAGPAAAAAFRRPRHRRFNMY